MGDPSVYTSTDAPHSCNVPRQTRHSSSGIECSRKCTMHTAVVVVVVAFSSPTPLLCGGTNSAAVARSHRKRPRVSTQRRRAANCAAKDENSAKVASARGLELLRSDALRLLELVRNGASGRGAPRSRLGRRMLGAISRAQGAIERVRFDATFAITKALPLPPPGSALSRALGGMSRGGGENWRPLAFFGWQREDDLQGSREQMRIAVRKGLKENNGDWIRGAIKGAARAAVSFASRAAENVAKKPAVKRRHAKRDTVKTNVEVHEDGESVQAAVDGVSRRFGLGLYETRFAYVAAGAAAFALGSHALATAVPVLAVASTAIAVGDARAPRKRLVSRFVVSDYNTRRNGVVQHVDQFFGRLHARRVMAALPPASSDTILAVRGEQTMIDARARQLEPPTPTIMTTPVVGDVLVGVDTVALFVESRWERATKRVSVALRVPHNRDTAVVEWRLLGAFRWQREQDTQARGELVHLSE